jgi:mono/diheme cytochrome c family protein
MRWRALLSLLALLWLFVLVAVGVGWGPFAGSSSALAISPGPVHAVPVWVARERLPQRAVAGAGLFARVGCTACHTYAGYGQSNLGAPDLTAIGSRHLGLEFEMAHLECPSCVNAGSQMPAYGSPGGKLIRELAIFLEASKGTR